MVLSTSTCPAPNSRQNEQVADENSGAFSSYRPRYLPHELVETKTEPGRVNIGLTFVRWPEKQLQVNANVAQVCWMCK